MRVEEGNLQQQISATTGRANEAQRVQTTGANASQAGGQSATDHVDLSSLTGRISQAMSNLKSHAAQRVGQLQKDYQAGRYQPSASQISSAIVTQSSGA